MTLPVSAAPPARLIENSSSRIVFEYTTPAWTTSEVSLGGESFQRIAAPGMNPLPGEGHPEIPIDVISLGIPADRTPRVTVEMLAGTEVSGVTPPPVPTQEFAHRDNPAAGTAPGASGSTTFPTLRLVKNAEAYADQGLYPLENASVGATHWLRHQRIVAITLQPFRYRASQHLLYVTTRMRVTVTLDPS